MAERPAVFEGARVLELGAGVGLCGLYAVRLGARTVTLTDCVPEVLSTLASSAAANHPAAADDDDDDDEEGWDFGHVRVRHLDWDDEPRACEAEEEQVAAMRRRERDSEGEGESGRAGAAEAEAEAEATTSTEQDEHGDADGRAPRLRSDESYALVLGSDVMCVCPSFVSARSPQRLRFRIATPTACSSSLLSADVSRIRVHRRRTSVGDELGDSWMRDPHIQRAV